MENRNCVSAESYVVDATGIPKEVRGMYDMILLVFMLSSKA